MVLKNYIKSKKIKTIHYDIALILILIFVVVKLIRSEDSNNIKFLNDSTIDNKTKIFDFKTIKKCIFSNFLINYSKNTQFNNQNFIEQKNELVLENNINNINNNNIVKKITSNIQQVTYDKVEFDQVSEIQRDNNCITKVEKTIDIKEKRLGNLTKKILKIPLAFVQMIAISIALLCLLIP